MNTGPLNENELEWLDDTLAKYAAEGAILVSLNWMAC